MQDERRDLGLDPGQDGFVFRMGERAVDQTGDLAEVFDVEAAFLYPWAVAFRDVGWVGLLEVGVFLMVLILALAYAWKKGVLEWV